MKHLRILFFALLVFGCSDTSSSGSTTSIESFLAKYGWTATEKLADYTIVLPASFQHNPGDFPTGLYWAYGNEFSKAIGLSLTPHLGKSVTATIYALKEELPESLRPYTSARAIVLTDNKEIIGAWIDKAGYNASACSLDRKTFTDIVSRSWGDWLIDSGVVNPNNELDIHLAQMTPEEIITTYYTAIDEQNFNLAYATLSRKTVLEDYLFGNRPDNVLFNAAYTDAYDGWPQVISAAKVKSVKISGALEYNAIVDMKFSKNVPTLSGDGTYGWFVILTKEVDGLGWRIQSIGTGP